MQVSSFRDFFLTAVLLACAVAAEEPADLAIGPRVPENPATESRPEIQSWRAKLSSDNAQEVSVAVEALARAGGAASSAALWELYNRGSAPQRIQAVRAIGQVREKSDAEYLLRVAVGDTFQAVRFAAAEELARMETKEKAVARLLAFTQDPNPKFIPLLRMRALYSIAHIGGPGALGALKPFLDPKFGEIAMAAAESIGMLNDPAGIELLVAALGKADANLKPAVADALEMLTQQRLRFDLIKWQQYVKEEKEKRAADASDESPSESAATYTLPQPKPNLTPTVDLVVVFDTTGSMVNIWPQVSGVLDALLSEFSKTSKSLRIATVKYRASRIHDMSKYLIEPKPFSRDLQAMRDDILDASFGGGSGGLHLGVRHALAMMTWRSQSKKLVLIVGDTTPRDEGALACLNLIKDASTADDILISTLFVKNTHGEEHRETYKRLALGGKGRFYEYNKAEKHLVDMLAEKIDVKRVELPGETAKKLLEARP